MHDDPLDPQDPFVVSLLARLRSEPVPDDPDDPFVWGLVDEALAGRGFEDVLSPEALEELREDLYDLDPRPDAIPLVDAARPRHVPDTSATVPMGGSAPIDAPLAPVKTTKGGQ